MSRYIDADAFDERIRISVGLVEEELTDDYKDGVRCTLEMLKTQPTADVVEVVHGEWIDTETGECKCSHCKNIYEIKAKFLYSYCPICGANMVKPITEMIDVFYANKHLYKKIGGKDEQIH